MIASLYQYNIVMWINMIVMPQRDSQNDKCE